VIFKKEFFINSFSAGISNNDFADDSEDFADDSEDFADDAPACVPTSAGRDDFANDCTDVCAEGTQIVMNYFHREYRKNFI
jgi:hypothetical protein